MTDFNKELIKEKLHEQVCKIIFTKANGDTRIMHATLKESLLPVVENEENNQKKERKVNPDVLAVYDVDASGWRSFRWDSLKDFSTEYNA